MRSHCKLSEVRHTFGAGLLRHNRRKAVPVHQLEIVSESNAAQIKSADHGASTGTPQQYRGCWHTKISFPTKGTRSWVYDLTSISYLMHSYVKSLFSCPQTWGSPVGETLSSFSSLPLPFTLYFRTFSCPHRSDTYSLSSLGAMYSKYFFFSCILNDLEKSKRGTSKAGWDVWKPSKTSWDSLLSRQVQVE